MQVLAILERTVIQNLRIEGQIGCPLPSVVNGVKLRTIFVERCEIGTWRLEVFDEPDFGCWSCLSLLRIFLIYVSAGA